MRASERCVEQSGAAGEGEARLHICLTQQRVKNCSLSARLLSYVITSYLPFFYRRFSLAWFRLRTIAGILDTLVALETLRSVTRFLG